MGTLVYHIIRVFNLKFYHLKRIVFTLFICVWSMVAYAQIGYNYAQFDLGLSGAVNRTETDFDKKGPGYAGQLQFTYNYSPFINYIAELQIGHLSGNDLSRVYPDSKLNFTNTYSFLSFRAQLQMGEIIDYSKSRFNNFFKNVYISAGLGIFNTNPKLYDAGELAEENSSGTIAIPLKAGYEVKIFNSYNEPMIKVDLGYQFNYIPTDNLDGITPLNNPYSRKNDALSQIVVGLKIAIGGYTSYRKSINY